MWLFWSQRQQVITSLKARGQELEQQRRSVTIRRWSPSKSVSKGFRELRNSVSYFEDNGG
ncbi:hypothetical protein BDV24DRAFT_132643 [Aspergillus arachidicola]|uniref:Uncharacterized protein n=1 Tax=Aspergillus arachidicola TaxID=656916 RepID=A0A5N6Y8T6_9EURO|nr:hypothetical protein BDV24DRAFT_132643 [Aspergillus arachidicola]